MDGCLNTDGRLAMPREAAVQQSNPRSRCGKRKTTRHELSNSRCPGHVDLQGAFLTRCALLGCSSMIRWNQEARENPHCRVPRADISDSKSCDAPHIHRRHREAATPEAHRLGYDGPMRALLNPKCCRKRPRSPWYWQMQPISTQADQRRL